MFARLICFLLLSPTQGRKEEISCLKHFMVTSAIQNPYYDMKACVVWPLAVSLASPTFPYFIHPVLLVPLFLFVFTIFQIYQTRWRESLLSGIPTLHLFMWLFSFLLCKSQLQVHPLRSFLSFSAHCVYFLHSTSSSLKLFACVFVVGIWWLLAISGFSCAA